jgi:hypothetical protein
MPNYPLISARRRSPALRPIVLKEYVAVSMMATRALFPPPTTYACCPSGAKATDPDGLNGRETLLGYLSFAGLAAFIMYRLLESTQSA